MRLVCIPIVFLSLAAAICSSAEPRHNALTAAERNNGWVLLFDGHSFDHWIDPAKQTPPGDAWQIEDGCLKAVPSPRIDEDLISRDTYRDFELQVDWKISPGGNSGIKYRIQALPINSAATADPNSAKFEDHIQYALLHRLFDRSLLQSGGKGQIYVVGFEYQLIDNAKHPDALRGPLYQSGALYGIVPPSSSAAKAVGEFNHSLLIVRGNHFEHWLNGSQVVNVDVSPAMLREALAKRWGQNAEVTRLLAQQPVSDCPFSLQNHNDAVWFRDIKIHKIN